MTEVGLKHYLKYQKQLEAFAKGFRIQIVYVSTDSEGSYIPSQRKIKIDKDLSESAEIATILHELGHLLDDVLMPKKEVTTYNNAYKVIYGKKYTNKHLKEVVKREKIAWDNGKRIARELNIPLGKWYDEEAKESIQGYKALAKK